MSKKVLIRKQAGGGLQYQVTQEGSKPRVPFMQNLAAVRGGAYGLNPDTGRQGFIPGTQLGDAKPTGMQRLAAGANIAGTGLAAALTGLQTAYGLQGGNLGALASAKDQFRANVGGLTGGSPTEAQQGQNMAMDELARQNAEAAKNAMMQQVNPAPTNELVNVGSSPAPAGLPTPPPAQTAPAQAAPAQPAPPVPAQTTPAPAASTTPSMTPTQAASMLPTLPQQPAASTTPSMTPTQAASMLPSVTQQPTSPTVSTGGQPQYAGAMPVQQPAAPVAVSQPVDNGLTPTQYPVLMPQQTHEEQRQQVAVREPVETPYTPQNTVNPFANPTGQKPGHPYNTGQYAPTEQQYGLSSNVDYRNRAMPPNFGGISWDSAVPSLGDDSNFNWNDFKRAFVSQVFDEFGDMLHKADPHVVGAVAMRAFLEKMLRK